jgi:uncharacterized protein (TIGR02145 family)
MKKVIALLALFIVAALVSIVVYSNVTVQDQNTFADPRDGKKYKYVEIGTQTWMAENLNYEDEGSKCYEDNSNYCTKYGRLYNWETAIKACPSGWHLPDNDEWTKLMEFIVSNKKDVHYRRGSDDQGFVVEFYENAGKYLMAKSGWKKYDFSKKSPIFPKCKWTEEEIDDSGQVSVTEHDNCPTDEYGFSALPGGRGDSAGGFDNFRHVSHWWSASDGNSKFAYRWYVISNSAHAYWYYINKSYFFSIRCLKGYEREKQAADSTPIPGDTLYDTRDGKKYKTFKTERQIWMAENLDYHGEDGSLGSCYEDGEEPRTRNKIKKPENCPKHGWGYDWNEAIKACPKGWHLPNNTEWAFLTSHKKYKSDFVLPGCSSSSDGSFDFGCDWWSSWWSATESDSKFAYLQDAESFAFAKSLLFSVRCLKD